MKTVAYSITKSKTKEKQKGIGYVAEDTLFISSISSKTGNSFIKAFEDISKYCFKKEDNSYSGNYEYWAELELKDDKDRITIQEIPIHYYIWFKELD